MILVLRQRNFSLLWFGGLISMLGNWMLLIGLPLYVYELTNSTLATSIMFATGMLPSLLFGTIAGVFVDRWNRKRTMVIANFSLMLCLLPLIAVRSVETLWIVYVVSFLQSSISQFVGPAENALLPSLINDEKHLPAANSLNALNNNLARLIGPPLGGIVISATGLTGVVLLDAVSFAIAGALIALINKTSAPVTSENLSTSDVMIDGWKSVWHDWVEGLQVVWHNRQVAVIFLVVAAVGLGEGVFITLLVPFATQVLQGSTQEVGVIMGAQAVGGLLGSVLIPSVSKAVSSSRLVGLSAIILGLVDLVIFNYPLFFSGILVPLILFVVAGVPGVGVATSIITKLQTAVTDEYRGRVFGAYGTALALLGLIGTTVAGVLGDLVGIVFVLNIQVGVFILAGVLALVLLRDDRTSSQHTTLVTTE
jgi:MFS family permease